MTMFKFVAVNTPGGFDVSVGGGGKDPRKPRLRITRIGGQPSRHLRHGESFIG